MLYYDNWCDVIEDNEKYTILIKCTSEDLLRNKNLTFEEVKKNLIERSSAILGPKPAVCLSGGVDSQVMINIWLESGKKFTPVFFKFANNLNQNEFEDASDFAREMGIDLEIIELDAVWFLKRYNLDYAKKYSLTSPQFSVHVKFLEVLKKRGLSGAALGGNGLIMEDSKFYFGANHPQLLDIENFSRISGFPVIPNFLSFDRDFCLFLARHTTRLPFLDRVDDFRNYVTPVPAVADHAKIRYENKLQSYKNLNFYVKPQNYKKTGFEQLKNYYNSLNNSFYAFEFDFRNPMTKINKLKIVESKVLDKEFEREFLN